MTKELNVKRNITLDVANIATIISKKVSLSCGVSTYKHLLHIELESDDYKNNLCKFYNVRRNDEWCNESFEVFAECKKEKENGAIITLETILRKLNEKQHIDKFEKSFASKMFATLDSSKPIIDRHVINHFNLSFISGDFETRLKNILLQYEFLEEQYNTFLQTEEGKSAIAEFDKEFINDTDISAIKKLDFLVLWKEQLNRLEKK